MCSISTETELSDEKWCLSRTAWSANGCSTAGPTCFFHKVTQNGLIFEVLQNMQTICCLHTACLYGEAAIGLKERIVISCRNGVSRINPSRNSMQQKPHTTLGTVYMQSRLKFPPMTKVAKMVPSLFFCPRFLSLLYFLIIIELALHSSLTQFLPLFCTLSFNKVIPRPTANWKPLMYSTVDAICNDKCLFSWDHIMDRLLSWGTG